MMAYYDAGGSMCEARFALYEHRKSQGDRTNASGPAGTLVPVGEREFGGSAIVLLGNICACAGAAMAAIASKAINAAGGASPQSPDVASLHPSYALYSNSRAGSVTARM